MEGRRMAHIQMAGMLEGRQKVAYTVIHAAKAGTDPPPEQDPSNSIVGMSAIHRPPGTQSKACRW